MSASRQDRDEMLDQVHADRSRAEQDRRYNAATTQLDKAIRELNRAIDCERTGDFDWAKHSRLIAGEILERIDPELLIIDPDAIL